MITPTDPRHGRNEGYNAGCHEECCRRAHMRYKKLRAMGRTRFYMDSLGSRRRVQALAALGYSISDLSVRMGFTRTYLSQILKGGRIRSDNAAAIGRLYDELSMTPSDHPLATRARRHALQFGWPPPLAWDDIDHDEAPDLAEGSADDSIDDVAVRKALDGEIVPLTMAERFEVVARQLERGGALKDLERNLGINADRYLPKRREVAA